MEQKELEYLRQVEDHTSRTDWVSPLTREDKEYFSYFRQVSKRYNIDMLLAPGTHSHFESGKFSQFWPEPGTNPAQWVRLKTPFRVHPKQPN